MRSSTRRRTRCSAAAAWTGPSTAPPGSAFAAAYVIHTVGPVWRGGGEGEPALLASCYRRCFEIARTNGLRTLAFPAISCGVYGYPIEPATRIAMAEARRALAGDPELEVIFATFGAETTAAYKHEL
jgi:O-acetyl-ADP-ribose deacetylase